MVRRSAKRRGVTALTLSSLAAFGSASSAAGSAEDVVIPPFVLPPIHYSPVHSFRGVQPGGRVDGFGISGHASGLPGVHDYLRLVPPNPLAHGAIFSRKQLTSSEWIAEIAFRVHGPTQVYEVADQEGGHRKREPKGGRGLAFWYTAENNPTAITISPSPNDVTVSAPPPLTPIPNDPTDSKVSLFGAETSFHGMGIIFDSSPHAPLLARSAAKNAGDDSIGASISGVVSGIMDDGKGGWLDSEKRVLKEGDEADYLQRAIGECEAAFRNAQGLLWARVSYVKGTIRVDLDLAPHTTLSKAGRDYAHNCFLLEGVSLPPSGYVGLSAMASGSPDPDAVDVYAMDVFEVVRPKEGETAPKIVSTDEPPEVKNAEPLEGTTDDPTGNLAHEIFLSQAKMIEAIDALGRRVDGLAKAVRNPTSDAAHLSQSSSSNAGSSDVSSRLASLENKISDLHTNSPGASSGDAADTLKHLLQLQDRLMVEVQAFGRKLDNANGQSTASLATLSSRSAESLQLLQRAAQLIEEQAAKGLGVLAWVVLIGGIGTVVGLLLKRGSGDDAWSRNTRKIL